MPVEYLTEAQEQHYGRYVGETALLDPWAGHFEILNTSGGSYQIARVEPVAMASSIGGTFTRALRQCIAPILPA